MHIGLKRTLIDPRDKRFRASQLFGAVTQFPDEYLVEPVIRDQNADRRATQCTAYAVTAIGEHEDGIEYSHDYQFMKTLLAMGAAPDSQGADARWAFKVATTFGLLPKADEPSDMVRMKQADAANPAGWPLALDAEAKKNVKPAYLPAERAPDYFDGIRTLLMLGQAERRTVGMATQWSNDFDAEVLPENPRGLFWGHMYEACGWRQVNGEPYLVLNVWQGKRYGKDGLVLMSRPLCNSLMNALGAYAATLKDVPEGTIDELKQRQIANIEMALAFCWNLVIRLLNGLEA